MARYEIKESEEKTLEFWNSEKIYEKVKEKTSEGEDYYFLDGPPYTSGKVHIGTAWNKSLKDMFLRYKRMKGFNVWDRAGYDMHGLPIEHKVEDKHNLKFKEDIIKFGVDKFTKECESFALENLKSMNEDFKRLGVWMDFENAYQSITTDFIEGEWWLIKRAHENNRLYEGLRTMTWCSSCATALAKHELEYDVVTEKSIFVKLKVKDKDNEFLVIWTTTPWTIPFNLAVMVNPELDYVRVKVNDEVWVLAKDLAAPIISNFTDSKLEVVEEFKGETLEGIRYEHPFNEVIDYSSINAEKLHTVLLSKEHVDTSAGSGLVHCAPGCGPEDYEVGHANGLPAYNTLNEHGVFPDDAKEFKDLVAKQDDKNFIEALEKRNALVAVTDVEHDYAHCWRCHKPVIFRATKQWFFKIEDLKPKMIEFNNNVKWVPDAAYNAFNSWLENLRDNSISKQRFWGCPIPIWKCDDCKDYTVIGSVSELEKLSGSKIDDLHKPWIDNVKIKCDCGKDKSRIPDVLDVWVDAGTTSWNCLYYPNQEDLFNRFFPADFILEGKDQIRGWFNLLMVASIIALDKPSFKNVYMHGFVQDSKGRKMSKSVGNYILPEEIIDKFGADTLRYYMIGGANPGIDINYNMDDVNLKKRNLDVLWNLHNFIIQLSDDLDSNPSNEESSNFDLAEKYIFSRLHSTIKDCTDRFDNYKLNEIPALIEKLFLDLSRTYVQLVRDKSSTGSLDDKKVVLYTLYNVLLETTKMFSTVAPFISEKIYCNLKEKFDLSEESIHLFDWPIADESLIDKDLESSMDTAYSVIQSILNSREKANLGVRWPLKEAIVASKDETVVNAVGVLKEIIMHQTNVRNLHVQDSLEGVKFTIKADFKTLGPDFGQLTPKIIEHINANKAEDIVASLDEQGKYFANVDGNDLELKRSHLVIEKDVPKPFIGSDTRFGACYINFERTDDLEAEGYARELMRRVQALRKNEGLEKSDRINLHIKSDESEMLNDWQDKIKEKVGADSIEISSADASGHKHSNVEKIKGKEFSISFT